MGAAKDPLRAAALAYLRDGRVIIRRATAVDAGPRRPFAVEADVIGHRSTYRVDLVVGEEVTWTSSCPCERDGKECPHIPAVQLVTGWPSAAAKGGE